MFRKISAQYIFTGNSAPLKRGIIVINNDNEIVDLIDTHGSLPEIEKLEFYDGIITPGFVNAHTHIELSHLKGKINQGTGLVGFIREIGQLRHSLSDGKVMDEASSAMIANGIVAAGDISNTDYSFLHKSTSKIRYYTFIEIFGFQESIAQERLNIGLKLLGQLKKTKLPGSLTPHAPYSISVKLWHLLTDISSINEFRWSVHNQESGSENQLFIQKTGEISDFLARISEEFISWNAPGISSLAYCQDFYKRIPNLLLVHNTFTSAADLECIADLKHKVYLVLCPNANLFIEKVLPDVEMLLNSGFQIALGTDSLASNTGLSILEEIKTIQRYFPTIPLEKLIEWGSYNGAKALGFDLDIGSIETGKKPGLNLITNINFQEMKLTSQSEVKVLA